MQGRLNNSYDSDYNGALQALGNQSLPSLYYKHSITLLCKLTNETLTLWSRCPFLKPRLLLPAMLAFESQRKDYEKVLEYLDRIIQQGNRDRVIHNYYFYLLCSAGREKKKQENALPLESTKLLEFIQFQSGDIIFDVQYAIRLATHYHLTQARVQLLLILAMPQQAVDLALSVI
jgi:hypothetical protein